MVLKWAQSSDGKLAWEDDSDGQRWISGGESRKDAHKLRRRTQAILVGINTVLVDDPQLTPRPAKGKKPLRVVLDSKLKIPLDCKLLQTAGENGVLVLTSQQALQAKVKNAEAIRKTGAEVLTYPEDGRANLHFLVDELAGRGIAGLLVEGGPTVIAAFLKEGLADEFCVYIAPKILGAKGAAEIHVQVSQLIEAAELHHVEFKRFGDDVRVTGLAKKVE